MTVEWKLVVLISLARWRQRTEFYFWTTILLILQIFVILRNWGNWRVDQQNWKTIIGHLRLSNCFWVVWTLLKRFELNFEYFEHFLNFSFHTVSDLSVVTCCKRQYYWTLWWILGVWERLAGRWRLLMSSSVAWLSGPKAPSDYLPLNLNFWQRLDSVPNQGF